MAHHEKCGPHEIFVGNTRPACDHFKWLVSNGLSSLRTGKVAYDIDGKPLNEGEGYAP